jgi:hypothetical protein
MRGFGLGFGRSLKILGLGLGLAASLSACSSLKSALGIDKKPPDEFAVVTKAPLVIPPDFALRPPRPGAQDSQTLTPAQSAEQTVFGKVETQQTATVDQSQGELALLESAGADRADGSIRGTMASDDKAMRTDKSLTDRLMFWKGDGTEGQAVNGAAEQERIKASDAEGKSPAEGSAKVEKTAAGGSSEKGGFLSHLWPF